MLVPRLRQRLVRLRPRVLQNGLDKFKYRLRDDKVDLVVKVQKHNGLGKLEHPAPTIISIRALFIDITIETLFLLKNKKSARYVREQLNKLG